MELRLSTRIGGQGLGQRGWANIARVAEHGGALELGRRRWRGSARRSASRRRRRSRRRSRPSCGAKTTPAIGRPSSTTAMRDRPPGLALQDRRGCRRSDRPRTAARRSAAPDRRRSPPTASRSRAARRAGARLSRVSTARSALVTGEPPALYSISRPARRRLAAPARRPRSAASTDQVEVGVGVGHRPAMARASTSSDGALAAPRISRSEPGTRRRVDVDQVAGHGDLVDRIGDLAVLEPEAGAAHRPVAGVAVQRRARTSR